MNAQTSKKQVSSAEKVMDAGSFLQALWVNFKADFDDYFTQKDYGLLRDNLYKKTASQLTKPQLFYDDEPILDEAQEILKEHHVRDPITNYKKQWRGESKFPTGTELIDVISWEEIIKLVNKDTDENGNVIRPGVGCYE